MLRNVILFLLLCSFTVRELREELEKLVETLEPNVHVGLEVVSVKESRILYRKNSEQLFVPGSALKLFTAAAALHQLGVDFRFETKLLQDGDGTLYLKGDGDPELSFRDLEHLAFQFRLRGIEAKDLVIDTTAFDEIIKGPGWTWDEELVYWNAPVNALTVDHNCASIWVHPAEEFKHPPSVDLMPKSDLILVNNTAETSEKEDKLTAERRVWVRGNVVDVKGQQRYGSAPRHFKIPIENPGLYAGNLLQDALSYRGTLRTGATPEYAETLAVHRSSPLSTLVARMLKDSDNLYASCLFKKMGQVRLGAPGSWQKGGQSVRDFLGQKVGIDTMELVLLDGSGESRYNLVSPHQMVSFLVWVEDQFAFSPEFMAALPVAGIDGALKERMKQVKGLVRAKTGEMRASSSLCGYVATQDGDLLAFALFLDGFIKPPFEDKRAFEDKVCRLLSQTAR